MKHASWLGWLIAGLLILQNANVGTAAATSRNTLEGAVLHHSAGALYVYHGGLKFAVQVADLGDQVIDAVPLASPAQWNALFTADSPERVAPLQPEPAPANS